MEEDEDAHHKKEAEKESEDRAVKHTRWGRSVKKKYVHRCSIHLQIVKCKNDQLQRCLLFSSSRSGFSGASSR